MHLTDYSEANLSEVRRWLAADPHAFDWRDITRAILRLEGLPAGPADVAAREALTRQRVTRVSRCDAKALCPLEEAAAAYDLLVTNFCLEAAAGDLDEWRRCMCAVLAYLRPGGRLVLSAVRGQPPTRWGTAAFSPCASLIATWRRCWATSVSCATRWRSPQSRQIARDGRTRASCWRPPSRVPARRDHDRWPPTRPTART